MTEAEWLACTEPQPMLDFLKGKASDRKLRLFALACCRRVWDWLDPRCQEAIVVTEQYLNGRASAEEQFRASKGAVDKVMDEWCTHHPSNAVYCVAALSSGDAQSAAEGAAREVAEAIKVTNGDPAMRAERSVQANLLRDVFHGPRRPVLLRSFWRSSEVVLLARSVSQAGQTFDRLDALAKALERAGCADGEILGHCRSDGPHVPGCWLVDSLMRKF